MSKELLKFGDAEIEKREFHSSKNSIAIYDVNIKKILLSHAFGYGKNNESSFSLDTKIAKSKIYQASTDEWM